MNFPVPHEGEGVTEFDEKAQLSWTGEHKICLLIFLYLVFIVANVI